MYNAQVYTGKEADKQEEDLAHRVVMDLVQPILFTGASIYMDNFYTSVHLLRDLHSRGLNASGTIHSNRKGLPTSLLPKTVKLQRGQFCCAQKDHLSFCTWVDTRAMLILSNFHDVNDRDTVSRKREHGTKENVVMPKMLRQSGEHERCGCYGSKCGILSVGPQVP